MGLRTDAARPVHRCRPLLLAVLLAASCAAEPKLANTPLRVMTFNVRLPAADDGADRWERRRDLLVETIREQRPDVIGTQELFQEQGNYIVRKLPQYAWFGTGRRGDESDEHMGVFYRRDTLRVKESGDFWLSETPEVRGSISWGHPFPRMVTWARFEWKEGGRTFVLFNTHLPYRDEDTGARERGAALILRRLEDLPSEETFVLLGDFNAEPGSSVHALLTRHLRDAWTSARRRSGPASTYHAFTGKPDRRIDWILVRGLTVDAVRTVTTHHDGRYPSDHFPVVADLAWPDRP